MVAFLEIAPWSELDCRTTSVARWPGMVEVDQTSPPHHLCGFLSLHIPGSVFDHAPIEIHLSVISDSRLLALFLVHIDTGPAALATDLVGTAWVSHLL